MAKVELVYVAEDQAVFHQVLELKDYACVEEVIKASGIWITHPETQQYSVGIYSQIVALDTPLKPNDRIEIYRPLISDPKEKRRLRSKRSEPRL